jgi:hypothetical protein
MPKSIIELAQNIGGVCMYVPLRYEQHLIIVSFTYISQAEAEISTTLTRCPLGGFTAYRSAWR